MNKEFKQGYRDMILLLNERQGKGQATAGYVTTLRAVADGCSRNPSLEPGQYHYYRGQIKAIDAWREQNK